jgi:hypothetical protein
VAGQALFAGNANESDVEYRCLSAQANLAAAGCFSEHGSGQEGRVVMPTNPAQKAIHSKVSDICAGVLIWGAFAVAAVGLLYLASFLVGD